MTLSNNERWIHHIRKLAAENADLRVKVRSLRLEVTALQDDVAHYQREFARQNAKIMTLAIRMEVADDGGVSDTSDIAMVNESKDPEA